MKRLKIILNFNGLYYFLLFIVFVLYIIVSNTAHISCYKNFVNEKFIISSIEEKEYGFKLELKGKEKVLGYLYLDEDEKNLFSNKYFLGNHILITGKKLDIDNSTVFNTFNYKKYLESNKIYNVIEIKNIKKINNNVNIFYKIKNELLDRTNKIKLSKQYINSLLFGNNNDIDEEVLESYRSNGISHLFAISGLHIAVFLYLLGLLLNNLGIRNKLRNIIFIIFLIYFMFLTSFSSSVMRASIFTILLIINEFLNLKISAKNILFLTLFVICITNSLALRNIGLLYSFVVTLFLIISKDKIKGNYLRKLFIVSFISFLASFPITAYNFYQVNILSILYNIIFVPFMSFVIIPMVIITYIFPVLDQVLYFFVQVLEKLSHFFEDINILKINVCKLNCIFYMSYYVILCFIVCKFKRKKLCSFTLVIAFIFISYINTFSYKNYILFFDVGQGDSIFVKLNDNNALIDTGGIVMYGDRKYTYNLSKNRIIPYLKSVGENKIDTLVLTHGDFDHMGEAKYLVSNFTVKRVIFNVGELNTLEKDLIKVLEEKNVKYYRNISKLKVDDTNFYFLNTRIYDNENDNSNVIYFEFNNKKFLFMGDSGVDKEQDILDKYNISNIDLLKVGHHGSSTSSSKEFIDEMNPNYSIISVGINNRYGHPNKKVLDSLNNSKIYRTDKHGSVMFKVKNNKLKIKTCGP